MEERLKILLLAGIVALSQGRPHEPNLIIMAQCRVEPNPMMPPMGDQPQGEILMKQSIMGGQLMMHIELEGFHTYDMVTQHRLQIRNGGNTTGGCYDPTPQTNTESTGDLELVTENFEGTVVDTFMHPKFSLIGPSSIVGKSIVVLGQRSSNIAFPPGQGHLGFVPVAAAQRALPIMPIEGQIQEIPLGGLGAEVAWTPPAQQTARPAVARPPPPPIQVPIACCTITRKRRN